MNIKFIIVIFCLISLQLFWVSCSSINDKEKQDERLKTRTGYKSKLLRGIKRNTEDIDYTEPIKNEVVRLDGNFGDDEKKQDLINRKEPVEEEVIERKPFYEKLYPKEELDKVVPIEGNLDNSSLIAFIQYMAEKENLNFNWFIEDESTMKGRNVNAIINNVKLTRRELWELFERILLLSNMFCTYQDGVVYIRPIAKMYKDNRLMIDQKGHTNVEIRVFHIRNTNAADVTNLLKDFLTDGAKAINIPKTNDLMVVELPENMDKIAALIKMLDVSTRSTWPKIAIHCENVSAQEIKKELVGILPILGYPITVDKAASEPGAIHLTSIDRLRVIIAAAANYEALDELRNWINILDRDDIGEQERVYVYKVINNTASDLVKAISAIFKVQSESLAAPTQAQTSTQGSTTVETKGSKVAEAVHKATTTAAQGERVISVFETPMKIFADGVHNRLIVRTTPRTYAMLKALLKRLDTIPSQVLLQVMIAEIILTDETEYGMEYVGGQKGTIKGTKYSSKYGSNWDNMLVTNDAGDYVPQQGFQYYIFKDSDPSKYAYVRAFAGRGKVKILSSPQIMALSDTKAQVKVGDRVPIATSEVSSANTTSELKQEIQYQDTGVILNLTPHITKGGRIAIDLDQTVSSARKTTSSSINSPTIQERKFITTLSLRDQSTIMVGGLISEEKEETKDSAPVLVDIPIVSNLLGMNNITTKRIELLVLITATIIDERTDLQDQILRYRNAVKGIETIETRAER